MEQECGNVKATELQNEHCLKKLKKTPVGKEIIREAERWLTGRDIKKRVKTKRCVSSICKIWDDLLDTELEKTSIIITGSCVDLHMLSEKSSEYSAAGGTDELQMG